MNHLGAISRQNKVDILFVLIQLIPIFALLKRENGLELVAQLVEQYTFNVWALGSSPSQFTKLVTKVTSFFVLRLRRKPRSGKIEALAVLIACYYKQTRI
jgi:hypothetical protein